MATQRTCSGGWLMIVLGLCSFAIGLYGIIRSPGAAALMFGLGILVALGSCIFLSAVILVLRRLYTPANWGKPSRANLLLLGTYLVVVCAFVVLTLEEATHQDRSFYREALFVWIGVGWISMGLVVLMDDRGVLLPRPILKSKSGLKASGDLRQSDEMAHTDEMWSQTIMDEQQPTIDESGSLNNVGKKHL